MARLSSGDILRVNNARFLVVSCCGSDAAACPVIEEASTHHRSDIRLSWSDSMMLGLRGEATIRCAPIIVRRADRQERTGRVDRAAMAAIRARVQREMEIQARENSLIRSDIL